MGKADDGRYAPTGSERGTDFTYKHRADKSCTMCAGFGEYHVPYEDYNTYIIHRCVCTDNQERKQ